MNICFIFALHFFLFSSFFFTHVPFGTPGAPSQSTRRDVSHAHEHFFRFCACPFEDSVTRSSDFISIILFFFIFFYVSGVALHTRTAPLTNSFDDDDDDNSATTIQAVRYPSASPHCQQQIPPLISLIRNIFAVAARNPTGVCGYARNYRNCGGAKFIRAANR